jgi:uncharacterized protein (TIGR02453 family)
VSRGTELLDIPALLMYLRGLKRNNDRTWFTDHRATFDELRAQFEDFITALLIECTVFDASLAYVDPKACIFRIYRDVRFSKEKIPYKTRFAAYVPGGGKVGTSPGYYIGIEPGRTVLGGGIYTPTKEHLAALRAGFVRDARPFKKIVDAPGFRKRFERDFDPLVTAPRGYAKDHPEIELIRSRRFTVHREIGDKELVTLDLLAEAVTTFRALRPFVAYLEPAIDEEWARE